MTLTIEHLPEPVEQFIQAQIALGRYQSPEELIAHAVKRMANEALPANERINTSGLFAHLNIKITEEDIAQNRREMFRNFPRDFDSAE